MRSVRVLFLFLLIAAPASQSSFAEDFSNDPLLSSPPPRPNCSEHKDEGWIKTDPSNVVGGNVLQDKASQGNTVEINVTSELSQALKSTNPNEKEKAESSAKREINASLWDSRNLQLLQNAVSRFCKRYGECNRNWVECEVSTEYEVKISGPLPLVTPSTDTELTQYNNDLKNNFSELKLDSSGKKVTAKIKLTFQPGICKCPQ